MKRRVCALFCLLCALLGLLGCGTEGEGERLLYESQDFSLFAEGSFDDTPVAFRLHHGADGTVTLTFSAPAEFVNLTYTVYAAADEGGAADLGHRGVTACYDGIEIPLSEGNAPCAIRAVAQAFSMRDASMTACKLADTQSGQERDTALSFSCEAGTVSLVLHGEHGLPKSLSGELFGVRLSLSFSEWMRQEAGA